MSKYTTELRHLIESGFDLQLNDYPIFDESYRNILNDKIINHFYFREIGDVSGKFRHFLKHRMNEIMLYYNQLYKSELINIDALTRLDYSENYDYEKLQNSDSNRIDNTTVLDNTTQNTNSTNNSNTTSSSESDDMMSDTPSSKLMYDKDTNTTQDIYASEVRNNKDVSNSTDSSDSDSTLVGVSDSDRVSNVTDVNTINDVESYIKHNSGNNAIRTDSEMLNEYRTTFLNIDMQVISELEDLFIQLW